MKKCFFCLFLVVSSFVFGLPEAKSHCLVLIHIGEQFPKHLPYSLAQARLFNPDCPIFLIGNATAFSKVEEDALPVTPVFIESLECSNRHKQYNERTQVTGFWRYALERFLLLDDFIQQYGLSNVFHIENDVMLYFDIAKKLPVFEACYPNMMASVFDCDERCVPSFVYIQNPETSALLTLFIADRAHLNTTDMELLSLFKDAFYKTRGDHLPILIPSYAKDYPLTNIFKNTAKDPKPYSNHLDLLGLIFDAAALGQFFGGIDPILGPSKPGFMGEASVFLPMHFAFQWLQDEEGRFIPYISYEDQTYPIANLHIHSKALDKFLSTNPTAPKVPTECFSSLPFDHIKRVSTK
jgi:hypothetical protein